MSTTENIVSILVAGSKRRASMIEESFNSQEPKVPFSYRKYYYSQLGEFCDGKISILEFFDRANFPKKYVTEVEKKKKQQQNFNRKSFMAAFKMHKSIIAAQDQPNTNSKDREKAKANLRITLHQRPRTDYNKLFKVSKSYFVPKVLIDSYKLDKNINSNQQYVSVKPKFRYWEEDTHKRAMSQGNHHPQEEQQMLKQSGYYTQIQSQETILNTNTDCESEAKPKTANLLPRQHKWSEDSHQKRLSRSTAASQPSAYTLSIPISQIEDHLQTIVDIPSARKYAGGGRSADERVSINDRISIHEGDQMNVGVQQQQIQIQSGVSRLVKQAQTTPVSMRNIQAKNSFKIRLQVHSQMSKSTKFNSTHSTKLENSRKLSGTSLNNYFYQDRLDSRSQHHHSTPKQQQQQQQLDHFKLRLQTTNSNTPTQQKPQQQERASVNSDTPPPRRQHYNASQYVKTSTDSNVPKSFLYDYLVNKHKYIKTSNVVANGNVAKGEGNAGNVVAVNVQENNNKQVSSSPEKYNTLLKNKSEIQLHSAADLAQKQNKLKHLLLDLEERSPQFSNKRKVKTSPYEQSVVSGEQ